MRVIRGGACAALLIVLSVLVVAVPRGQALSGTASYAPAESDLSGKPWVSAAASQGDPRLALDGSPDTAWMAPSAPASLTVDLGGAYDAVHKVVTTFAGGRTVYRYRLEGSADGESWSTLADRTTNTQPGGVFADVFAFTDLRYVRLTITSGTPVGVKDLAIFNYLRPDMDNGSDTSEQGGNTSAYYYNAGNNPPVPGIRGGRFSDPGAIESGNDFFGLTKDLGWDTIRLRVWNEPRSEDSGNLNTSPGNDSPENTRRVAKAVIGAGQNLAIDLHYADSWADPQHQPKPYAWSSLPFDDLVQATYSYTHDFIKSLVDQGTTPSIVALGNEITNGMMWGSEYDQITPYVVKNHQYYTSGRYLAAPGGGVEWMKYEAANGDTSSPDYQEFLHSIDNLARLIDAGNRAVRDVNAETGSHIQTQLHFAFNELEQPVGGGSKVVVGHDKLMAKAHTLLSNLAEDLNARGGMVDRIGLSYYPDWHGSYDQIQSMFMAIHQMFPTLKLNIAETSPKSSGTLTNPLSDANHPVGFVYTTQSQGDDSILDMETINDLPDNIGTGVWPWAGTNVYGVGNGANGTLRASFKAWNDAFAKNVLESRVSVVTDQGAAPRLPATVKSLDTATGAITNVPVVWDAIDPASYAQPGTFTVHGVAQPTVPATGRGQAMTAVTATVDVGTWRDLGVGGTVPATLSLSLGAPASFGAFTPGVADDYDASTTADVISTAGDASLSVTDPSDNATGRLVNGASALTDPLQANASSAGGHGSALAPLSTTAGTPLTLLTYAAPVSHDTVTIGLRQHIGSSEPLRTGSYAKTLTFTLSTTTP
jgi:arabinogalactan endo-1,4-beta-galactosidase